jgi:hypothetical protein
MSINNLSQLKALNLFGMATALAEIQAESPRISLTPDGYLHRLIDAEIIDRQARTLRYQLNAAKFPIHRDRVGFVWQESPLPQAQIQQLASASFMEEAHNRVWWVERVQGRHTWRPLLAYQRFIKENGFVFITRLIWLINWKEKNRRVNQGAWYAS